MTTTPTSRLAGPARSASESAFSSRAAAAWLVPAGVVHAAGRPIAAGVSGIARRSAMLEACRTPELITEITLQPVRRHGVDAAILFSDIVVPLVAVGLDIEIVAGRRPGRSPTRCRRWPTSTRLRPLEPDRRRLRHRGDRPARRRTRPTPLIGFAGAPFTLASYLVEGGPSREHAKTKALMHAEPELWHALLGRLAVIAAGFLQLQIDAGVSAVQLFDSWAGALSLADYEQFVAPHSRSVLESLAGSGVPRIHFGVGTGELLGAMRAAGADVVGVDWRVPLDEAARRLGPGAVVQGNLDPALLLAPWPVLEAEVRRVVEQGRAAAAHIFNLGHGVLPETDPAQLTRVVELVHSLGD